jgi:hypothetical protein
MGLQASIDITYSKEIELESFIRSLINIGWNINDYDRITYLTNDDFDWESTDLIKEEFIMQLMLERFKNNEIVGITLTLSNLTGCLFHFMPGRNEVMILLNINRVKFNETLLTDYTFYINNLYPILKDYSKVIYSDII